MPSNLTIDIDGAFLSSECSWTNVRSGFCATDRILDAFPGVNTCRSDRILESSPQRGEETMRDSGSAMAAAAVPEYIWSDGALRRADLSALSP